jgi:hypothetical protein
MSQFLSLPPCSPSLLERALGIGHKNKKAFLFFGEKGFLPFYML